MLRLIPGLFFLIILSLHCSSSSVTQKNTEDNHTAYMGILYTTSDRGGVVIMEVFQNSPAEKAELNVGDLILKVNGQTIAGILTMKEKIQALRPGTVVTLDVIKINLDHNVRKVNVKLDRVPERLPPGRYYSR